MYTILENARIVIALLKAHNIRNIVLSPGGSNIPVIQAVQQDPFFKCYSIVDERSAMYFAIGLYLRTGEIVATSCTTANATRNYIPGLTEAFYKHVPILAITMSKHPMYYSQEYMQCPIQTSLPIDCVKKSYSIPRICNDNDRAMSVRIVNEAILELNHHGMGPVQLNIEELDNETWEFSYNATLPTPRVIKRYYSINDDYLKNKKVLILIGEHVPFSEDEIESIDSFCDKFNACVYVNHLSNFHGKYSINANLLLTGMSQEIFDLTISPDILITIGGITGDYSIYKKLFSLSSSEIEHWRVSVDGNVVDTYNKLTRIYQTDIISFFKGWHSLLSEDHSYYEKWKSFLGRIDYNVSIPFSNVYIAQVLHGLIPVNSYINFAILNSLRSWMYFDLDPSIKCFSNVASFGIDGCMSTFLGESVVCDNLCFLVIGDLSFFYDMNSIGIRHIKNNVRILLINNNGGVEFKLGSLQSKTDVGAFIAADNQFKNAEGWALTQGYKYFSASNKEEFSLHIEDFISYSNSPIIFEVFTSPQAEKVASNLIVSSNRNNTVGEDIKYILKDKVKSVIGEKTAFKLKSMIR